MVYHLSLTAYRYLRIRENRNYGRVMPHPYKEPNFRPAGLPSDGVMKTKKQKTKNKQLIYLQT